MTYCYLTMDILSNFENNAKPLVVLSEYVFLVNKAFYTLIFASKNVVEKLFNLISLIINAYFS